MDTRQAITAFDALSQETRLEALRLLIKAGPEGIAAGSISDQLGIRQNTMSMNLKILAQAGLIRSVRDGRTIRYRADFDGIQKIVLYLMKDCCGGRPELCQPILDQVTCEC
jgi:DNA-binding transcriptional ArsR family regulator